MVGKLYQSVLVTCGSEGKHVALVLGGVTWGGVRNTWVGVSWCEASAVAPQGRAGGRQSEPRPTTVLQRNDGMEKRTRDLQHL
uniref:Uncharacterized protein n=1 Tax=Knipowitschia caucasica TaxID=637954 RepID=A0AAV2JM91_KNICA